MCLCIHICVLCVCYVCVYVGYMCIYVCCMLSYVCVCLCEVDLSGTPLGEQGGKGEGRRKEGGREKESDAVLNGTK